MVLVIWLFSFLINDALDWKILLILNPDAYIPFLDELAILITDFSMYLFATLGISYLIGYAIVKNHKSRKQIVSQTQLAIGITLGVIAASAYFWAGYDLKVIFFGLALMIMGGFWLVSRCFTHLSAEKQSELNDLLLVTLLAWTITALTGDVVIKNWVGRLRPLAHNEAESPYYEQYLQLRTISDEIVRSHYSYVSGHSSTFFAFLTPAILYSKKKYVKGGLFLWAAYHSFTRVYLAAHFPYCAFMGSLMGITYGIIVYHMFYISNNKT